MEFDDYAYFFVDQDTVLEDGIVPGGYCLTGTEILLLDPEHVPVGPGQIGEIAIRSRYNTAGYWRRPDLTQAAFLDGAGADDERTYLTGDVGRMRADGCLFHLGRKDFQVKIRGHRVEVAEVEATLLEIDGIKEAAVVGWEDTPGNKRLVAYIVPTAEGSVPSFGELRRSLSNKLPDYMVPFTFITLDRLPLTATYKVDRRSLPPPGGTRPMLEAPFVAPRNPVEETLARIWAGVLALDQVGVHDNFFELGGDSLSATRVMTKALMAFQTRLSLHELFEAPTVAELTEIILQKPARQAAKAGAQNE